MQVEFVFLLDTHGQGPCTHSKTQAMVGPYGGYGGNPHLLTDNTSGTLSFGVVEDFKTPEHP
jgi:hypothetical protein